MHLCYACCLFWFLLFLCIISLAFHLLFGPRAAILLLNWLIDWHVCGSKQAYRVIHQPVSVVLQCSLNSRLKRLASGDQRRLTGSGSALEACLRRWAIQMAAFSTLLTYSGRHAFREQLVTYALNSARHDADMYLAVLTDFVPLWHDLARHIAGYCGNKIRASVRIA